MNSINGNYNKVGSSAPDIYKSIDTKNKRVTLNVRNKNELDMEMEKNSSMSKKDTNITGDTEYTKEISNESQNDHKEKTSNEDRGKRSIPSDFSNEKKSSEYNIKLYKKSLEGSSHGSIMFFNDRDPRMFSLIRSYTESMNRISPASKFYPTLLLMLFIFS